MGCRPVEVGGGAGRRHGQGRVLLAQRDADEGLSGERSYTGVYRWYYHPDHAIKVSRLADGHLDVTNGYHRLYVARRMGVNSLPAVIR